MSLRGPRVTDTKPPRLGQMTLPPSSSTPSQLTRELININLHDAILFFFIFLGV